MWVYQQSTGNLYNHHGDIIASGYSGKGIDKNNPESEQLKAKGPIPRGLWVIGDPYKSKKIGPFALPLYEHLHNAHGRTYFRIHGDSIGAPGTASLGCIILGRYTREQIHKSKDRLLMVIA